MAKKTKAELQKELAAGKSVAEIAAEHCDDATPATPETKHEEEKNTPAPASEVKADAKAAEEVKKAPGKIKQILDAFKAGKTNKEIATMHVLDADGKPIPTGEKDDKGNDIYETFHPTTISIQVSKYKKANPDLYPPQPPAPTKKQLAEEAKAKKAAETANTPKKEAALDPASADAEVANVQG